MAFFKNPLKGLFDDIAFMLEMAVILILIGGVAYLGYTNL